MNIRLRKFLANLVPQPDERTIITKHGHREFVSRGWDHATSKRQFDFLLSQGLSPWHVLLDIGCGSLRAGRLFIPYLDKGNYLGLDKHAELIEAGKANELTPDVLRAKRPEFVVSDNFAFDKFSKRPSFCIAQSVFSHLRLSDIARCLTALAPCAESGCQFFATFFEISHATPQLGRSHSTRDFYYSRSQMEAVGERTGWSPHYIGEWNHPNGQKMIRYSWSPAGI